MTKTEMVLKDLLKIKKIDQTDSLVENRYGPDKFIIRRAAGGWILYDTDSETETDNVISHQNNVDQIDSSNIYLNCMAESDTIISNQINNDLRNVIKKNGVNVKNLMYHRSDIYMTFINHILIYEYILGDICNFNVGSESNLKTKKYNIYSLAYDIPQKQNECGIYCMFLLLKAIFSGR